MPITGSTLAPTRARLGVMRLGASRLDHYAPSLHVTINGTNRNAYTRFAGINVNDYLDGTPNKLTCRVAGFTPTKGHEIKMALGQLDAAHYLFAGHVMTVTQVYEGLASNVLWDLDCISYEWLLNRRTVTQRWTNVSASVIAAEILASYTSGFTATAVVSGLDVIDEFTCTNEEVTDAFDRLSKRIGGYWYVDYVKALHFFVTETDFFANTIDDADNHGARGVAISTDLSQVKTRALVEGGGSNASADVAIGQTTIPVEDSSWYSASGGMVMAGPQRITYTSKSTIDGTGSKVGGTSGLAPGIPTASLVAATPGNLTPGDYRYGVSFVLNGGETEIGNNSTLVNVPDVDFPNAGSFAGAGTTGGSLTSSANYLYSVSYTTAAGETVAYAYIVAITGPGDTAISLTNIPVSSDARVTGRNIYRSGIPFHPTGLVASIGASGTTHTDTVADAAVGVNSLTASTAGSGRIDVADIDTGPAGTTARKLYRSPVNVVSPTGYRLLTTISGNVTDTFSDNIGDGSLGVIAPASSTVGPTAGATSVAVQDCALYASGGGWAQLGSQVIRYTGRSASSGPGTLTGVPASGLGSLTASVPYDTPLLNAPHLTGVSGVLYAFNKGEPVNLFVTRNDTAAQTAMAGFVGGDGIHEAFFQDRRLSEIEAAARGDAHLTLAKDPLVTVTYQTRDQTTRSGRTVTFGLGAPTSLSGTFKIQSVTISDFDLEGVKFPMRAVQASSRRFSLESILRLIKAA